MTGTDGEKAALVSRAISEAASMPDMNGMFILLLRYRVEH